MPPTFYSGTLFGVSMEKDTIMASRTHFSSPPKMGAVGGVHSSQRDFDYSLR
jgi:hypothetical protein